MRCRLRSRSRPAVVVASLRSSRAQAKSSGALPVLIRHLVISVLALFPAVGAWSFECPQVKPSTSRQPGYGLVAGQAYCEGFFEKTVSQPFVELVSLTRGPGLKGDASTGALELRAEARSPLQLLVQPLRSVPYYRVDAELLPGQAVQWDPAQMLAATGLRASELGFLALVRGRGADRSTAVVPVALTSAAQPSRQAIATVRASVDVSSIAWRGYRLGVDRAGADRWIDVPGSQRYAFARLEIPIELPSDGSGIGIDIQALDAKDGRALPLLRLSIMGPQDAVPNQ